MNIGYAGLVKKFFNKDLKNLVKKHKKIEIQIKKISKLRLNDRTSKSWVDLRELKKEKLNLKDKINSYKYSQKKMKHDNN